MLNQRLFRICRQNILLFIGLIACFTLLGCATHTPKNTEPSLVAINAPKGFDHILLMPNGAMPKVSKVFIEPATVALSSYWEKEFRGDYSDSDLERIHTSYAKLLNKSLAKAFEKSDQLVVVNNKTEADTVIVPALENLYIYAPDLSFTGRRDQYIREAGSATVNLRLLNKSGQPVAQFIDSRETFSNPSGIRERADRVTNARYFSRLMDRWSNNLVEVLTGQ